MKLGITYDTGFFPGGRDSWPRFSPGQAGYDMGIIARDLGCTAVRITGGNPERLAIAAEYAAAEGLDVWFSPFPCELNADQTLALFADCAAHAEALRQRTGRPVVLVLGCEVSVFNQGFLPGSNAYERMRVLAAPSPELYTEYPAILSRLNAFLGQSAEVARGRFAGPVTYAAGMWEQIDWTPFHIVGADAYRDSNNAATFDQELDALFVHGKPVAITEFGCCTYRGAAARGANGWAIVTGDAENQRLDAAYVRDELEQVNYLRELAAAYERHGVDIAFWFTFASWNRPHREGPLGDLDLASFGVVKLPGQPSPPAPHPWEPKAVFHELAKMAQARRSSPT